MATKITNYLFVEREDNKIVRLHDFRETTEKKYSMLGFRCNYAQDIVTSNVKEVTDSEVLTCSGSVYEISEMNTDYKDFLEAIDRKIPIMRDWSISGSLRHGYFISGMLNDKSVHNLKITHQTGNSLFVFDKNDSAEKEIFVDWYTMDKTYLLPYELTKRLKNTDLRYCDFTDFCRDRCKIKFFPFIR